MLRDKKLATKNADSSLVAFGYEEELRNEAVPQRGLGFGMGRHLHSGDSGLLEQICIWMGMIVSRVGHAEEEGNE